MKLIVGLGNPGEKYINTRHNTGFIFVNHLCEVLELSWAFEKKVDAEVAKNAKFILAKPQGFMNNSGVAVAKLLSYFKVPVENLVVVHDDVDLPFGEYRLRQGSGSAGHHGVIDIIEKIGTQDFWRFRIGVGRPSDSKYNVEDYVLKPFAPDEVDFIRSLPHEFLL